MKWKSALRPRGWHFQRRKMKRISCLFLSLFPSQSLIQRSSGLAVLCPFALKCFATGKPGALLVLCYKGVHQHVPWTHSPVQQRILPSSWRGGHGQQNGPELRMPHCRICRGKKIAQQYTGINIVAGIAYCRRVELEVYIAFGANFSRSAIETHDLWNWTTFPWYQCAQFWRPHLYFHALQRHWYTQLSPLDSSHYRHSYHTARFYASGASFLTKPTF